MHTSVSTEILQTFVVTVNCYEPPIREQAKVTAKNLDEAFEKVTKRYMRKYKAKRYDISITGIDRA